MIADGKYLSGFGNHFETEAVPGALPKGQNNPQRGPFGLYAEQLSGSAFTAPNVENQRTWLYRILPSVAHGKFKPLPTQTWQSAPLTETPCPPDQIRWDPVALPSGRIDFIGGLTTICAGGDASARIGSAAHIYALTTAMHDRAFYNADGDFLFVPEFGGIELITELGRLSVEPQEIAVVPRGIKMKVLPKSGKARGYLLENYGEHFTLPWRGPIGANGLANQRDFLTPVAWYEDVKRATELVVKFDGRLYATELSHSPFDVVAWHGNYAPYKYDLRLFNAINSVSFDHPDPSIFTVLTSPGVRPGTANVDFVIFPPRWMVAERTFRPPYFHRNVMSEYMGLVHGVYDAKPAGGFVPGGGSLHNCMSAHGPETAAFLAASKADLAPSYLGDTLAFMFESSLIYRPTLQALESPARQKTYAACWEGMPRLFTLPR